MRIHSDTLTSFNLYDAARLAGVEFAENGLTHHGSRSRDRAFNVLLRGNSRRRPNSGNYGAADDYAATWDQWGVFLGYLYSLDPNMIAPPYVDDDDFHYRTDDRFDLDYQADGLTIPFPLNHDHTFRYEGTPYSNTCSKCGATQRW